MDTLNRDADNLKAEIADARDKSKLDLFPGCEDKGLPDAFKALLARYALADALALYARRPGRRRGLRARSSSPTRRLASSPRPRPRTASHDGP